MKGNTRYLFDSDVLIASARIHYNPSYCQLFWDWMTDGYNRSLFFSIDKVKGELLDGKDDPLSKWANSAHLKGYFLSSSSSLPHWKELSKFANDPKNNFSMAARTKFLNSDKADAWLISYAAQVKDFVIVTNEVSAPASKNDIKLPDAAAWLGIKTIKLVNLFHEHAGNNFTLK